MADVLNIKNLSKNYTNPDGSVLKVLKDISLKVKQNEFVSIIGRSGCGKSTLLDSISELTLGKSSYMMQDDVLLPWRTVWKNLTLPYEIKKAKENYSQKIISLSRFFGLEKFLNFNIWQLSGGMKKRVSLLRTYCADKKLLLLDEPFSKLDAITALKLKEWFIDIWQKKKLSVLLVTHDIDEAIFFSDRVYIMAGSPGKITNEIEIALKRPRNHNILLANDFIRIKRKLISLLDQNE